MKRLEKKLKKEVKKSARVISNAYSFKTWEPAKTDNFVFLYRSDKI